MGLDVERLVAFNPDQCADLVCCICSGVFEDPTSTTCDHTFCLQCLIKWKGAQTPFNCPVCRASVEAIKLRPTNSDLYNKWRSLRIRCNYQRNGCQTVVRVVDLQNHLQTCAYRGHSAQSTPIEPTAPPPSAGSPTPSSAALRLETSVVLSEQDSDSSDADGSLPETCCCGILPKMRRICSRCGDGLAYGGNVLKSLAHKIYEHRNALMYTALFVLCAVLIQMGIAMEYRCPDYRTLPTGVLIFGICSFLMIVIHMIKHNVERFRTNRCRILYLLLYLDIAILLYLCILLYPPILSSPDWIPPGKCNGGLLFISFWLLNTIAVSSLCYGAYHLFLKSLCIYLFE